MIKTEIEHSQNALYYVEGAPGSGKTTLAIETAIKAYHDGKRILFVTTSNVQSFDIARRILQQNNKIRTFLFLRHDLQIPSYLLHKEIHVTTKTDDFATGSCIVLGNASKWTWRKGDSLFFDLMIIDDASSIRESIFMQISGLSQKYLVLNGIFGSAPIVRSNTQQWAHMPIAPNQSICQNIFRKNSVYQKLSLSHRLPQDSIDILYPNVFPYQINAPSEERRIHIPNPPSALWTCIDKGASLALAICPNMTDEDIAYWIAHQIRMLLSQNTSINDTRMHGALSPAKIGVVCSEQSQILLMEKALGPLSNEIIIDIHLHMHSHERALIFAFHPINGLKNPSTYHWDRTHLELVTTRHRIACILISRPLLHTRPTGLRGLYQTNDPILDGYNAHRKLQNSLSCRIFMQEKTA